MSANPSVISELLPHAEAPPTAALDEAALVARLAAGDRDEAAAALYDLYGRRLYSLGVHLLHDRGLAEDLVQETFVRLWRSAQSLRPRAARRCGRSSTRWPGAPPSTSGGGARAPRRRRPHAPETEDTVGGAAFDEVVLRLDVGEALDVA